MKSLIPRNKKACYVTLLFISLTCIFSRGVCQSNQVSIVSVTQHTGPTGFPVFALTLNNASGKNVIITKFKLELIEFVTNGIQSIPETRELKPIAYWDLDIPIEKGVYTYHPKYPVQIAKNDAGTIEIRIHRDDILPEDFGYFRFKLIFVTADGKEIKSRELTLGTLLEYMKRYRHN